MRNNASLGLGLGIMVAAGFAVISAWSWPWKAALFPLSIGIPMFVLAAIEVLWVFVGKPETNTDGAKDFQLSTHLPPKESLRRTCFAIGWILALFAAVVLIGFPLAVPLFVFLYMRFQGGEGWVLSVAFAAIVWACFYGLFDYVLHLPFPDGWIQTWLGLAG